MRRILCLVLALAACKKEEATAPPPPGPAPDKVTPPPAPVIPDKLPAPAAKISDEEWKKAGEMAQGEGNWMLELILKPELDRGGAVWSWTKKQLLHVDISTGQKVATLYDEHGKALETLVLVDAKGPHADVASALHDRMKSQGWVGLSPQNATDGVVGTVGILDELKVEGDQLRLTRDGKSTIVGKVPAKAGQLRVVLTSPLVPMAVAIYEHGPEQVLVIGSDTPLDEAAARATVEEGRAYDAELAALVLPGASDCKALASGLAAFASKNMARHDDLVARAWRLDGGAAAGTLWGNDRSIFRKNLVGHPCLSDDAVSGVLFKLQL